MPREELRSRIAMDPTAYDALLTRLMTDGGLREVAGAVALPDHRPVLDGTAASQAETFLRELEANPYAPAVSQQPGEEVLAHLEDEGRIVRTGDGVCFGASAYQEMTGRIVEHLKENHSVTLAQARDMFGTSRKYAQSLLEHLDAQHVTRRVGDERVLRAK
jgi:selenocysteine-specific elongation factor